MTFDELMKDFRSYIIANQPGWPNEEFRKALLPYFKIYCITKDNSVLNEMKANGYLDKDDMVYDASVTNATREKTRQARRQYVYDCIRNGAFFPLTTPPDNTP